MGELRSSRLGPTAKFWRSITLWFSGARYSWEVLFIYGPQKHQGRLGALLLPRANVGCALAYDVIERGVACPGGKPMARNPSELVDGLGENRE